MEDGYLEKHYSEYLKKKELWLKQNKNRKINGNVYKKDDER